MRVLLSHENHLNDIWNKYFSYCKFNIIEIQSFRHPPPLFPLSLAPPLYHSVSSVVSTAVSNVKRVIPSTADGTTKQDGGVVVRKAPSHSPPSPLLGSANNPNKADIPDRKTGNSLTPNVSACV